MAMPRKPLKPCTHPGCPRLTAGKYCEEHKEQHRDREGSYERGYDRKWKKARLSYLKAHPLCVRCMERGIYVEAVVVDHVTPHRGNPELFWDRGNWQSLCKACHDKKTFGEDANPVYHY